MAVDYSRSAKIFYNTGTHDTPVWVEATYVKDVTLPLTRDEIDAITRSSGAYKAFLDGHIDNEVTFRIQYHSDETSHAAMRTRCLAGTLTEFAIMNGSIETEGKEGLWAAFYIMGFDFDEPIAGVFEVDVRLKLAQSDDAPTWHTVPAL